MVWGLGFRVYKVWGLGLAGFRLDSPEYSAVCKMPILENRTPPNP